LAILLKDLEKRKMDDFYIEKILKGDHNSFQYFINTYKRFAFSLAFAILKDRNLTEDVVQDSFIKAFKGLKSFKRNASFQTWFGKIVINESLRKANYRTREYVTYNEISNCDIEVVNDSINSLILEEQKIFISVVFEQLPINESVALELFYIKEYSIEEIIEITGWSASKIKMLLLRGRKNFYARLKKLLESEVKEII
jgi:RNA polymerase sigma-70 factor, ECF subfamily